MIFHLNADKSVVVTDSDDLWPVEGDRAAVRHGESAPILFGRVCVEGDPLYEPIAATTADADAMVTQHNKTTPQNTKIQLWGDDDDDDDDEST